MNQDQFEDELVVFCSERAYPEELMFASFLRAAVHLGIKHGLAREELVKLIVKCHDAYVEQTAPRGQA